MDSMLQAQIAREEADLGNLDEDQMAGNGQQAQQHTRVAAPIVMHRPRYYPPPPNRQPVQQIHTVTNSNLTREQKDLNALKSIIGWDDEDDEPEIDRRRTHSSREDERPGP